jgi:hypothetical protein
MISGSGPGTPPDPASGPEPTIMAREAGRQSGHCSLTGPLLMISVRGPGTAQGTARVPNR